MPEDSDDEEIGGYAFSEMIALLLITRSQRGYLHVAAGENAFDTAASSIEFLYGAGASWKCTPP